VTASRGKIVRAEPVSALYEQGKVSHVGAFPALEDQMCGFASDFNSATAGYSPDRVDALVWVLSELMTGGSCQGWADFYTALAANRGVVSPPAGEPPPGRRSRRASPYHRRRLCWWCSKVNLGAISSPRKASFIAATARASSKA
jgi:hypothetical protein